jgi:hypothetical protein
VQINFEQSSTASRRVEEGAGSPFQAAAPVEQADAGDEAGASDEASPMICVLEADRRKAPETTSQCVAGLAASVSHWHSSTGLERERGKGPIRSRS